MSMVLKRRKLSHEANGEAVAKKKKLEKKNRGGGHQQPTDEHGHGSNVKVKGGQLKREEQEVQEVQREWERQEGQEKQERRSQAEEEQTEEEQAEEEQAEEEQAEEEQAEEEQAEEEQAEKEQAGGEQERQDQGKDSSDEGTDSVSQSRVKQAQDKIVNPSTSASGPQVPQKSFADLGIMPSLVEACTNLNYKYPTPIQVDSIPPALSGRDLIALAETGSGKTAAFALPILQSLWDNPRPFFACILAPTRELAFQISEAFDALGGGIGVKTTVIVGGMEMTPQAIALGKRPHIIVATPGRLLDHLENTKGFSLRGLKYLVMDEADKLLDLDFGPSIDKILKVIPKERNTYLFSATMTSKVEKLQRASLSNPLRIQVSSKYQTVKTLLQYYILVPFKHKDTYLVFFANEFAGQSMIIFTRTVAETQRLSLLLRTLGFAAVPLHGQLSQSARLGALTKFKSGSRNILVATDVAARGLDIPHVDCVLNYDCAQDSKTYIHRVGRTARAGRAGKSISITTQYDVELLLRVEAALGKKLDEFPTVKEDVLLFSERVEEAQREAVRQMKEQYEKEKGRRGGRVGGKGGMGKKQRGDFDREEE